MKKIFFIFFCLVAVLACTKTKEHFIMGHKDYSCDVIIFTNIKHGSFISYDLDGSVVETFKYRFNKLHGEHILYYDNPENVHQRINFHKGRINGKAYQYYPNGNLCYEIEYIDNRMWNIISYLDIYGNTLKNDHFKDGEGRVVKYDSLGVIVEEGYMKKGFKSSWWRRITNTGHIDSAYFDNGIRSGTNHQSLIF